MPRRRRLSLALASLALPCLLLSLLPRACAATHNVAAPDTDDDLESFVSRPDLRAPKFNVQVHEPDLVSPGYWFVAAYSTLREIYGATLYVPAQTGPHIYDGQGNLVWSGASLFEDGRAVLDFRAFDAGNGTQHLSMLLYKSGGSIFHPRGAGVIFDDALQLRSEVRSRPIQSNVEDMHEFHVIDEGRRALMITSERMDETSLLPGPNTPQTLEIGNHGFAEIDTVTGETLHEWWTDKRVWTNESFSYRPRSDGRHWDWLHLNSVDKDEAGNYLISARFTNTIYKISGADGSILWRLGGRKSDFVLENFNFSAQHDARFRNREFGGDGTTTYISFLDNACADAGLKTSQTSSGKVVALDTSTMTARLVTRLERPDGELSVLRGNLQMLPNGNFVAGWSENAYITEFAPDGRVVAEASFASLRLVTYRAYKFNFTSRPHTPPTLKAFVWGVTPRQSTTVFYASWNGATQVASWRFWARRTAVGNATDAAESQANATEVVTVARDGFETSHMAAGCYMQARAEALGADGATLGRTAWTDVVLPKAWRREGVICPGEGEDEARQRSSAWLLLTGGADGSRGTGASGERAAAASSLGSHAAATWLFLAAAAAALLAFVLPRTRRGRLLALRLRRAGA